MHEMSLCEGVVGLVEDEAARQRFTRVKSIVLQIGVLIAAFDHCVWVGVEIVEVANA